jgi:hypothetical protein
MKVDIFFFNSFSYLTKTEYAETSMRVQMLNNLFPNNRLFFFRDDTIGMKKIFFLITIENGHTFLAAFVSKKIYLFYL